MQILIELAPLIAFFVAYKFAGIYVATAVLMGGMLLLVGWDWLSKRAIPKMHLISTVMVWVFGTVTLLLRDVRFIQWKATVFYWLIALALGGSIWIGKKTVLERIMTAAMPPGHTVPPESWKHTSWVAALFYLALGGVNLWVAYTMSEKTWVFFKTWLTIPLVFVFTAGLLFWLLRGHKPEHVPKEST